MARIDIQMDYVNGELVLIRNITNKLFYPVVFVRLKIPEAEKFYLVEIVVNPGFEKRMERGFYFTIPYTPVYKPMLLRLRIDDGTGSENYIINRFDNSCWFQVVLPNKGEIRVSAFFKINDEGFYFLKPDPKTGLLFLYSGYETDLLFNVSKKQNEVFLLKAFPSNLYQFPTTGVGLSNYINSNLENSGLALKLKKEFEADKMIIQEALLNSENGSIILDVNEYE